MSKKLIATASVAAALVLGGGAFALGFALNKPAVANQDRTELTVGRYYLENGTKDEYVEVYDDQTLQVFGLDYLKLVTELNADYVAGLDEEGYQDFVEFEQDLVDFWNSRHQYKLLEQSVRLYLDPQTPSGMSLYAIDENTLEFDADHIYIYAE
ncbi:MAG: hypothetical protein J1F09_03590 [Oscillospiraceae bacterium]|nr:hypothetical protein [Oscillospiraceae bacterium]